MSFKSEKRLYDRTSELGIMIIIISASHDNEMNDIYNDKIYIRRSEMEVRKPGQKSQI